MEYIFELIETVESDKLQEILQAVLTRYRELYPNWEFSVITTEKGHDRNASLDRMIRLLETMKE